jgi:hypothetical protein
MFFFKRLVLFIVILAALILFFGLFPVVAHSTSSGSGSPDTFQKARLQYDQSFWVSASIFQKS